MEPDPKVIGVGLISVGWMGTVHARSYASVPLYYPELNIRTRLVMAADTSPDRVDYAREVLGFEAGSTDYRDVLANPDVDVVSICAPNFLHEQMACEAAAAGKSFWLEKPAGRDAEETQRIAEAAADADVVGAVGFNYRNAPAIEYARSLVSGGELGRIVNVRGAFFADYSADPAGARSWRFRRDLAGSGVLGDLMGHLVDLVHYVVGAVEEVSAATSTVHTHRPELPMGTGTHFVRVEGGTMKPVENEDFAALLVRFSKEGAASGAVGTLEASRVANGPRASYALEIYGTEGSLKWDFERMNELELALVTSPHVGFTRVMAGPGFGDFSAFQPGAGTSMGYDDLKTIEAKRFLLAVLGQATCYTSILDGLAANRVLSAAERAAESDRWEQVETVLGSTAQRG